MTYGKCLITRGWWLAVVLLLALTLGCQALAAPPSQAATPTKGPPPTPAPRGPNPRELEKWNPPPTVGPIIQCIHPVDKLTPEESAVAVPAAAGDSRVKALLAGKRHRFHSAESIDVRLWLDRPKSETGEAPPLPPGWHKDAECQLFVFPVRRISEVRYFNYTDNVVVAARVDLQTGEVTQVDTKPAHVVGLGEEEKQVAARLAQADPRVQAGADGQPFVVSGVKPTQQGGPDERLALVVLNASTDQATFGVAVLVDLLNERVTMVHINRYPR